MNRVKQTVVSVAIASIPITTLCLFVAIEIYVGNQTEFALGLKDLLPALLPYALIGTMIVGLPGVILTARGALRYWAILASIGVLFWLQGNILVWDYGVLDGREIHWLDNAWRGALDTAIWVCVIGFAIVRFEQVLKPFVIAALATVAIQTVGTVVTLKGNADAILTTATVETNRDGLDAIARFSRVQNVVHIVMDGFQSDIFADIVGDSELGSALEGFTMFRDNLGAYPYTQLTVPALLSGKLYRNNVPVNEFIEDTIQGTTILGAVAGAGFEVDVAAPVGLRNVYTMADHSNAYGITASYHVTAADYRLNDSAKLIDLALFRVVPHFAKALVHRDELWVFQSRLRSEAYLQMRYFSDIEFLARLADKMTVSRDVPVYKMIHVMLSHKPTVGNAECEFDGKKPTTKSNVTGQATCGLKRVVNLLQRMRELGIYDDSLIVLMADHGAWVPVDDFEGKSDDMRGVDSLVVAMATPVLAIKPPRARGPMNVSSAQTSIVDVPVTIADLLGIDAGFPGVPVFDIDPAGHRERVHMTYAYGVNQEADGYLFPMQEYRVVGRALDGEAWQAVKRHVPAHH